MRCKWPVEAVREVEIGLFRLGCDGSGPAQLSDSPQESFRRDQVVGVPHCKSDYYYLEFG